MFKRSFLIIMPILVCALALPAFAADDDMASMPVVERQYVSYEPRGINVGRVTLYPEIDVTQSYTDNVFLEDVNTDTDSITNVRPSVRGVIDLKPHKVEFLAETEIRRHAEENSEDQENYKLSAKAYMEVVKNINLITRADFVHDHEERTQSLTLSSPESPIEFATRSLRTRLIFAPAKLQMAFYGGVATKAYEDNQIRDTDTDLIQRDKDYTAWHVGVRTDYDVSPSLTPYVDVSRQWVNYKRRDYVGGNAFDGIDRDRVEDRFRIGAGFELGKKVMGDVAFGLGRNMPEEPTDKTRKTWIADAGVTWLMSAITNVGVRLTRFLDDDNDITQGVVSTTAGLRLDHELARGFVASFDLEKQWRSFQSSPREDDTVTSKFSLNYSMNRYWALAADLQYAVRDAVGGGVDYDQMIAALRLKGRI